jgi:hypothetical protein
MLNVVKYILAALMAIGGGVLAAYKFYLGGGLELVDWASSGLLAFGGAGYILYPLVPKMINGLKNMKLPKLNKMVETSTNSKRSDLADNREAIDHLMSVGVDSDNKVIIEAMIALNSEVFKMQFQGKK